MVGEHATAQVSVVSHYLYFGGFLHHRDVGRVAVTQNV